MAPITIIPNSNDTLRDFVLLIPSTLGSAWLEILIHKEYILANRQNENPIELKLWVPPSTLDSYVQGPEINFSGLLIKIQ